MAIVLILLRAKEPGVEAVGCPQGRPIGVLINDCFYAGWCHWVPVPIVWTFEHLICGAVWLDARAAYKIDGVLYLGGKFVPQLNWEVGVGCAQCSNEMIFEGLDGSFGGIDAVVVWFYKLDTDLLGCEVCHDPFLCLIVHDHDV
jgi:hypothetical protein